MAYEFKKLSEVAAVETPADTANVLIEEDGAVKKVPVTSVSSGIKTAIITDNWYDAVIAGATEPPSKTPVIRCSNMTYEEARAILASGEPLDVFLKTMFTSLGYPINTHGIVLYNPSESVIRIIIITPKKSFKLFWSADGFNDGNEV